VSSTVSFKHDPAGRRIQKVLLGAPKRFRLVYLLPLLHLCGCLTIMIALLVPRLQYLGIGWGFIMLADLPISLVAYGLAWKYGWLAAVWIAVAGTLWWYLFSRGMEIVFEKFRDRGPVTQTLISKNDVDASTRPRG
jgi:hypothetical protein